MKRVALSFLLIVLFFGPTLAFADSAAEEKALGAANQWLELMDEGNFDETWNTAAALFKNAISKSQWTTSMKSAQGMFGKARSRKLLSKKFATSLPGAPDGQYVVIQYRTSFEKKRSAIETVTPMLDAGGIWRVSGYFIR